MGVSQYQTLLSSKQNSRTCARIGTLRLEGGASTNISPRVDKSLQTQAKYLKAYQGCIFLKDFVNLSMYHGTKASLHFMAWRRGHAPKHVVCSCWLVFLSYAPLASVCLRSPTNPSAAHSSRLGTYHFHQFVTSLPGDGHGFPREATIVPRRPGHSHPCRCPWLDPPLLQEPHLSSLHPFSQTTMNLSSPEPCWTPSDSSACPQPAIISASSGHASTSR